MGSSLCRCEYLCRLLLQDLAPPSVVRVHLSLEGQRTPQKKQTSPGFWVLPPLSPRGSHPLPKQWGYFSQDFRIEVPRLLPSTVPAAACVLDHFVWGSYVWMRPPPCKSHIVTSGPRLPLWDPGLLVAVGIHSPSAPLYVSHVHCSGQGRCPEKLAKVQRSSSRK